MSGSANRDPTRLRVCESLPRWRGVHPPPSLREPRHVSWARLGVHWYRPHREPRDHEVHATPEQQCALGAGFGGDHTQPVSGLELCSGESEEPDPSPLRESRMAGSHRRLSFSPIASTIRLRRSLPGIIQRRVVEIQIESLVSWVPAEAAEEVLVDSRRDSFSRAIAEPRTVDQAEDPGSFVLVDVRSREVFNAGRLPGALHPSH